MNAQRAILLLGYCIISTSSRTEITDNMTVNMNARNRILLIAIAADLDEDPAVRRRGRVWVHNINRGKRQFGVVVALQGQVVYDRVIRHSLSSAMFVDLLSPASSLILIVRLKKVTMTSRVFFSQKLKYFLLEVPRALRQKNAFCGHRPWESSKLRTTHQ